MKSSVDALVLALLDQFSFSSPLSLFLYIGTLIGRKKFKRSYLDFRPSLNVRLMRKNRTTDMLPRLIANLLKISPPMYYTTIRAPWSDFYPLIRPSNAGKNWIAPSPNQQNKKIRKEHLFHEE
jgi:hypothetical protein